MIALKKESYDYREVAEILSVKTKHIKKLISGKKLTAFDIRFNNNPTSFDIRFVRVLKSSLIDFLKARIVCKSIINNNKKK